MRNDGANMDNNEIQNQNLLTLTEKLYQYREETALQMRYLDMKIEEHGDEIIRLHLERTGTTMEQFEEALSSIHEYNEQITKTIQQLLI